MHSRSRLLFLVGAAVAATVGSAQPYTPIFFHPAGYESSTARAGSTGFAAGFTTDTPLLFRAAVWNGSPLVHTDIHPASYKSSQIFSSDGLQAVGQVHTLADEMRAGLWDLADNSFTNMHPGPSFAASTINDVDSGQQIGQGIDDFFNFQALLWAGSAGSAVSLNPVGHQSLGNGMGGGTQIGSFTGPDTSNQLHACVWQGTAASIVDIHPAGYIESRGNDTIGTQHVGTGIDLGGVARCLLWTGNNSSVSLHPAGYYDSYGTSLNSTWQVGFARTGPDSEIRAMVWSGSSATAIDLHSLLPSMFVSSNAHRVDADGNVYGEAVYLSGTQLLSQAVVWKRNLYSFGAGFLGAINDPADPETVIQGNGALHVEFRLTDAYGNRVQYEQIILIITKVGPSNLPPTAVGTDEPTDEGGEFIYKAGADLYTYKLKTKDLEAGFRYRLTARIVATGQEHSVTITKA